MEVLLLELAEDELLRWLTVTMTDDHLLWLCTWKRIRNAIVASGHCANHRTRQQPLILGGCIKVYQGPGVGRRSVGGVAFLFLPFFECRYVQSSRVSSTSSKYLPTYLLVLLVVVVVVAVGVLLISGGFVFECSSGPHSRSQNLPSATSCRARQPAADRSMEKWKIGLEAEAERGSQQRGKQNQEKTRNTTLPITACPNASRQRAVALISSVSNVLGTPSKYVCQHVSSSK